MPLTPDLHAVDARYPCCSGVFPWRCNGCSASHPPQHKQLHHSLPASTKPHCPPQNTNRLFCPSCCLCAQLATYVLCPYRPKAWSGSARRTTRRGLPSCSLISKSITCPISSPTSPRRPVCTILFWVRVYDNPSCQSKHNFISLFISQLELLRMSNLDLCPVL